MFHISVKEETYVPHICEGGNICSTYIWTPSVLGTRHFSFSPCQICQIQYMQLNHWHCCCLHASVYNLSVIFLSVDIIITWSAKSSALSINSPCGGILSCWCCVQIWTEGHVYRVKVEKEPEIILSCKFIFQRYSLHNINLKSVSESVDV